jgi:DNA-binding PadR family transcriptional regulator
MRVMLCWSGARGKAVAAALRDWLPSVIQFVEPWMSEEDIEKGSRWEPELDKQLESANFGILCLTPESLKALYIHYEAGALSKIVNESHVCPYLIGLEPTTIVGPLTKFQAARANKEDTFKLIKTINSTIVTGSLSEELLSKAFNKWWPDLELYLSQIIQNSQEQIESKRSDGDMIKEVLEIVRDQHKILLRIAETTPTQRNLVSSQESNTASLDESNEYQSDFMNNFIKANKNLILISLISRKPMGGYDLIKEIFTVSGVFLSQGMVYSTLINLIEKGIIESTGQGSSTIYSVSPLGKEVLLKMIKGFDDGLQIVNSLVCL